jgi:hypothetical protein
VTSLSVRDIDASRWPRHNASMRVTARATLDTRYSFTALFSSSIFARRSAEIEAGAEPDGQTRTEHLGLVTAAIMQSAAAVEAESAEVLRHGPGHHLGSNGVDTASRDFLAPLAKTVDRPGAVLDARLRRLHPGRARALVDLSPRST